MTEQSRFRPEDIDSARSVEAMFPVVRMPFHMHDGENHDSVGLVYVNDRIRKQGGEMTARWGIKNWETVWIVANIADQ